MMLCDRFGGTPSQWENESWVAVNNILNMWDVESKVDKARRQLK